jgi:ribosomal protein S18 acetylase RimI-like enzyme
MPPSAVIRAASAGDARTLASLRAALFSELEQAEVAEGMEGTERSDAELSERNAEFFEGNAERAFANLISQEKCFAWLAEAGHEAVSSVVLLVFPRLPTPRSPGGQEGYLLNVYTTPEWRGRGLAAALVREAITKAKSLGLARIRLHATDKGQSVYAAEGFVKRSNEMELVL